jgi:GDP-fucose transporter C1
MLAFYLWGNEATLHGVVGIFTVLGGSLLYTYAKMNENNHQAMLIKSVSDVEMPSTSSRNGER